MNPNPYRSPASLVRRQTTIQRLLPYLILNGTLATFYASLALLPFLLPAAYFFDISASANGDPVTYQITMTSVEWSGASLVTIPVLFLLANGSLFVLRDLWHGVRKRIH